MIPKEIEKIIKKLNSEGKEAYIVGGCVRDWILGIEPKDFDITTNALPDETLEIFQDYTCYTIGKKFGTIGVLTEEGIVEITTYRVDGEYTDHRKPGEVEFSRSLIEDLKRRDFTMNAIAYNPEEGFVDPFHGKEDTERKIIRSVGNPEKRLEEDGLRILRALRFMGQLDFELNRDLEKTIEKKRNLLQFLSKERIRDEVDKILLQEKPSKVFRKMLELHVLEEIFPELIPTVDFDQKSPYHDQMLFDHILCVVDHAPRKLSLRLAALFHDVEKPSTFTWDEEKEKGRFFGHDAQGAEQARKILRKYREPNSLIHEVSTLIREHMKFHEEISDKALRRQIHRVGEDLILDLYDLMGADMACTFAGRDLHWVEERKARIQKMLEENIVEKSKLAIGGADLIEMGWEQGPEIGKVLKELQELVIDEPEKNTRETLLNIIKNRK
ncbi:CCA tRNA nucleotidyltransferase [Peptoniphilus sp. KCTC 25270]|uniref:CCA tRNA nucleotidyltransferase n=1 Tax=Peptoniphilus sp. KCTC 25270 TaxID=2897414 RepID=UPI001E413CBC|nr:CCA tRNA nucleotidyltransferase [Peptoniphilus sp. KCTC 25270]MCD1147308.1 CCA tRNA nucleotidyltransferase [Peptoniphilus sp. KCTC 25270]